MPLSQQIKHKYRFVKIALRISATAERMLSELPAEVSATALASAFAPFPHGFGNRYKNCCAVLLAECASIVFTLLILAQSTLLVNTRCPIFLFCAKNAKYVLFIAV